MGLLKNFLKAFSPQQQTILYEDPGEPDDLKPWKDPSTDPMMKPKAERMQYHDNLNHMFFQGNGIFSKTRKKRTIKPFIAFSYDDAIATLTENGFIPSSIQIERCCPEPPTEAQLAAMRDHHDYIPPDICKLDASSLISRYIDRDDFAGKPLLDFVTKQKIPVSYYIGREALMSYLWKTLDDNRRVALYMLCVKRKESGKWEFGNFEKYTSESARLLKNETFVNSFKRICNITNLENISKKSNCYKMVLALIIE